LAKPYPSKKSEELILQDPVEDLMRRTSDFSVKTVQSNPTTPVTKVRLSKQTAKCFTWEEIIEKDEAKKREERDKEEKAQKTQAIQAKKDALAAKAQSAARRGEIKCHSS
jgi:hypothetical protein